MAEENTNEEGVDATTPEPTGAPASPLSLPETEEKQEVSAPEPEAIIIPEVATADESATPGEEPPVEEIPVAETEEEALGEPPRDEIPPMGNEFLSPLPPAQSEGSTPAPPISDPLPNGRRVATPAKTAPGAAGGEGEVLRPVLSFLDKLEEFRDRANQARAAKKQKNLDSILAYAQEHNRITNDEVEKITGVHDTQALKYLDELVKNKKLVRFGYKRNIHYKPIK